VQVTRATFIPLLAPGNSPSLDAGVVREEYCADLTLVYSFGPPFGRRVVTHADLDQMGLTPRTLRRAAFEQLEKLSVDRAQFHGQPPSVMLTFDGLESSLLLATEFWTRLQSILPGELVVGVPARDVVIVTSSQLSAGLEKVRRAVDRVFFAGDENLLTRSLLVRRGGTWEPFDRAARQGPRPAAHAHTADAPPRQYQEHPSWPGERVPVATARDGRPLGDAVPDRPTSIGRPGPSAIPPLAPAAATGMPIPGLAPIPGPAGMPGPVPMPAATSLPPMSPTMTGSMAPISAPIPGPMPTSAMPMPMSAPVPRPGAIGPTGLPSRAVSRPAGPVPSGPPFGGPRPGAHAARTPDPVRMPERPRIPDPPRIPQPPRMAEPAARVADAAQYSAIPYSAVPYSAVPYSAVPSSAVPYSAVPYSPGRSGAPVSPAGYPQPAFSRGARSRQSPPKPSYRDDPNPTSGGSYNGFLPVSAAPYPFSAPPGGPRPSSPPYPAHPSAHSGPAHPAPSHPGPARPLATPGYEPNPPYQGHSPRDHQRDPAYPTPGYPAWGSETSANDTFSGLFARSSETPAGRSGYDGRSGPRARFAR
jgi:hypothetical protein